MVTTRVSGALSSGAGDSDGMTQFGSSGMPDETNCLFSVSAIAFTSCWRLPWESVRYWIGAREVPRHWLRMNWWSDGRSGEESVAEREFRKERCEVRERCLTKLR